MTVTRFATGRSSSTVRPHSPSHAAASAGASRRVATVALAAAARGAAGARGGGGGGDAVGPTRRTPPAPRLRPARRRRHRRRGSVPRSAVRPAARRGTSLSGASQTHRCLLQFSGLTISIPFERLWRSGVDSHTQRLFALVDNDKRNEARTVACSVLIL